MAIFETPWYQIDTDDLETADDVKEMIRNITDEGFALCRECPKSWKCNSNAIYPEDSSFCLRREDYRALLEVLDALRPYAAKLAAKDVA
jgi:hypothetical protein